MSLQKQYAWYQFFINLVAIFGWCTCVYAVYVEFKSDDDKKYKPMCDVSEKISCSKAFLSRWGRGYGIVGPIFGEDHMLNLRNPIFGLIFYTLVITLSFFQSQICAKILLWFVIASNIASIYLAMILYFDVESLCLVCLTIYIINFILLCLTVKYYQVVEKMLMKKLD